MDRGSLFMIMLENDGGNGGILNVRKLVYMHQWRYKHVWRRSYGREWSVWLKLKQTLQTGNWGLHHRSWRAPFAQTASIHMSIDYDPLLIVTCSSLLPEETLPLMSTDSNPSLVVHHPLFSILPWKKYEEILWNPVKSNEIQWNPMKSCPSSCWSHHFQPSFPAVSAESASNQLPAPGAEFPSVGLSDERLQRIVAWQTAGIG